MRRCPKPLTNRSKRDMDRRPPSLPVELTYECFRLLFPKSFFEPGSFIEKPGWKDIEGLTLASKQTREIIFSLWFHVLRILYYEDWKVIVYWKRLYEWTRVIHYWTSDYGPKAWLEPFRRLNSIRIDQPEPCKFVSSDISIIIREAIPGNVLQHLEIRVASSLEPTVMEDLAVCLPNLRTLRLEQCGFWCGLCMFVTHTSFTFFPKRIIYDDGGGLPYAYSQYLAPLRYLHTVSLTITCQGEPSPYEILFSDAPASGTDNSSQVVSLASGSRWFNGAATAYAVDVPVAPSGRRAPGWLKECHLCLNRVLMDDNYRKSWVASCEAFYGTTTNPIKGLEHPSRPPSLRRVEWEFLNQEYWPDYDVEEMIWRRRFYGSEDEDEMYDI